MPSLSSHPSDVDVTLAFDAKGASCKSDRFMSTASAFIGWWGDKNPSVYRYCTSSYIHACTLTYWWYQQVFFRHSVLPQSLEAGPCAAISEKLQLSNHVHFFLSSAALVQSSPSVCTATSPSLSLPDYRSWYMVLATGSSDWCSQHSPECPQAHMRPWSCTPAKTTRSSSKLFISLLFATHMLTQTMIRALGGEKKVMWSNTPFFFFILAPLIWRQKRAPKETCIPFFYTPQRHSCL